jgi:hypothetical protein
MLRRMMDAILNADTFDDKVSLNLSPVLFKYFKCIKMSFLLPFPILTNK